MKFFKRRALIETVLMFALFSGIVYYMGRPPAKAPANDQVQVFSIERLSGPVLQSAELKKPTIFVFWATWCPPCKVELARLQALINAGAVASTDIVAVSVGEDRSVVEATAKDRGYTFEVALDTKSLVAEKYAIGGTPTLLFRRADGTVAWRTSGISPTLEVRALSFLSRK
jgi:cytochrome c biogenesis protein CcmG, thiol:disulfide interchange protein DsbE